MQEVPSTPVLLLDGSHESQIAIGRTPFTIGRQPGSDLLLEHPFVSRRHAEILYDEGAFTIVDQGSRHGTFVNGKRVERKKLTPNDAIHFGTVDGPLLRFGVRATQSGSTMRELLGHLQPSAEPNTAIEKLRWFLEAARKLNDVGAVDQILVALVEQTMELTQVERGYVFLYDKETASLHLSVGLSADGRPLTDDATISHSAIDQAIRGTGEYIVTDTLSAETMARSDSMIAQNIRTVICIPLRSRRVSVGAGRGEVLGILYLDSRLNPGKFTQVDNDLLKTIATEAAALVDNAQLAIAEENERRYREELNIAASIQQNLMAVQLPDIAYAQISARFVPCKEIGGDFYDVVATKDCVYFVIADVSGKGVSAAILAQTMQGMVYAQLLADQKLEQIATALNRYICAKNVGKYATMILLRLDSSGDLEYLNCGHVQPLLRSKDGVHHLTGSNLPVGLLDNAEFHSHMAKMEPGMRLLVVTDGVTEAENEAADFFGNTRLDEALRKSNNLEQIYESVSSFCGAAPSADDCTLVEVLFR